MASLVADYGDSSGNSDEDGRDSACTKPESTTEAAKENNSVNFFAEAAENNGSDDSDDEAAAKSSEADDKKLEAGESVPRLPNPFLKTKLPSPHLGFKKKMKKKKKKATFIPGPTSSVFVNPFEQAEQVKLGILEKHVRLTEAAPTKPASKQVCFKFKKGKCFLGDKCRFFHDRSNIALGANADRAAAGETTTTPESEQNFGGFGRGDRGYKFPGFGAGSGLGHGDGEGGQYYHPVAQFSSGQPVDLRAVDDEDSYMATVRGKKRCGVTDTMHPPKKAMMNLGSLRQQERPWTVGKKS